MRKTMSVITVWMMSMILCAAGMAWAEPPAGPVGEIQDQLSDIQEELDFLQLQIDDLQTQTGDLQNQIANIPPAWSQQIPASLRFVILADFNNEAVLDLETGLVWERSPNEASKIMWASARVHCYSLNKGGRKGWRLPKVEELASLVDPSVAFPAITLPIGHPFSNVQSDSPYWTTTPFTLDASSAWAVDFGLDGNAVGDLMSSTNYVWCVRGGFGVHP
jgi:hypothetical protein